jgi:hypothetical protein
LRQQQQQQSRLLLAETSFYNFLAIYLLEPYIEIGKKFHTRISCPLRLAPPLLPEIPMPLSIMHDCRIGRWSSWGGNSSRTDCFLLAETSFLINQLSDLSTWTLYRNLEFFLTLFLNSCNWKDLKKKVHFYCFSSFTFPFY